MPITSINLDHHFVFIVLYLLLYSTGHCIVYFYCISDLQTVGTWVWFCLIFTACEAPGFSHLSLDIWEKQEKEKTKVGKGSNFLYWSHCAYFSISASFVDLLRAAFFLVAVAFSPHYDLSCYPASLSLRSCEQFMAVGSPMMLHSLSKILGSSHLLCLPQSSLGSCFDQGKIFWRQHPYLIVCLDIFSLK